MATMHEPKRNIEPPKNHTLSGDLFARHIGTSAHLSPLSSQWISGASVKQLNFEENSTRLFFSTTKKKLREEQESDSLDKKNTKVFLGSDKESTTVNYQMHIVGS